LHLLSTSIGGVLEGARYLKALNDVGVTAMRMQRVASFGSLAERIRHEAANPLAVARLAATNLRSDLQDVQSTRLTRRLDIIETSLNEVSNKLLDLLKFSQRIGFVRTTTHWNDVVREVLIWLAAERQRCRVEMHVTYEDLPPLLIEPNELFGALVTVLRLAMETLGTDGGLIEVRTSLSADDQRVCTEIRVLEAPLAERISRIIEPAAGAPEELSPLHFEWALAQETVETQYEGSLTWNTHGGEVRFVCELPLEELP